MESTLNQFKSNFLQYTLTGDEKYKTAYEASQKLLDSMLVEPEPEPEPDNRKQPHVKSRNVEVHQISQTWKYWVAGGLGILAVVLMF